MAYKASDDQFIAAWKRCGGSPVKVAAALQIGIRAIYDRRASLEKRGVFLQSVPADGQRGSQQWAAEGHAYKPRTNETLKNGWLIVGSDFHFWPGKRALAFEALLAVCKLLKPKLFIANGDVFDGANVSRHEPMGWQKLPTVIEELGECKARLADIRRACPGAKTLLTVGNHDSRFDRRLATETAEFGGVTGFRLSDHFKDWPQSYTVMINEEIDPVFVVHNIKGGIHAPYNNIKAAGCSVITGHLHAQKAEPFTTLLHDWEGIDAGMMADRDGPQFTYRMDRPADWRSGFVAMRFDKNGKRFPAEFCRVQYLKGKERAVFRSEVVAER